MDTRNKGEVPTGHEGTEDDTEDDTENGTEKVVVLPLNEDSKKITQTLSNDKSMKILGLLAEKPMSATEISKELGLSLTTIKYNIDSLLEADLIKVNRIKWSPKGREVKIYEPVQKLIVVAPGNLNVSRSSIVSLLQQYLGVIAAAFFGALGIELFSMNNNMGEVPAAAPMMEMMADDAGGMEMERVAANKAADAAYAEGGGLMDSITSFIAGLPDHMATWFFLGCLFAVLLIVIKKRYYDNRAAEEKSTFKKVFALILLLCLFAGAYSALTPQEEYYHEDLYYPPPDNDPVYIEFHIFGESENGLEMPVNVRDDIFIELNDNPDDEYQWVIKDSADLFLLEERYLTADEKYRWTFEADSPGTKHIQMDYVDTRQNITADSFNLTLDVFDV